MKRYIKYFLFFILIGSMLNGASQNPLGNEWINFSQSYYKIKIHQTGIYRIDYQLLSSHGIPISSIDPRSFQLFNQGNEIAIFIEGENDGSFDNNDYIEFYGKKNDGLFDAQLYKNQNFQKNKAVSIYTDTAVYFLTWNQLTTNLRVQEENDTSFSQYTPIPYVWNQVKIDFTDYYNNGKPLSGSLHDAEFVDGEGWCSDPIYIGSSKNSSINAPNPYTLGPNAELDLTICGGSSAYISGGSDNHHLRFSINNTVFDTTYHGYNSIKVVKSLSPVGISNNTVLNIASINDLGVSSDRNLISYIKFTYPHNTNLGNQSDFEFSLNNAAGNKVFAQLSGFTSSITGNYLYDLSQNKKIKVVTNGSVANALIPNSGGQIDCYLFADSEIMQITQLHPVNNGNTTPYKFQNYLSNPIPHDYIIISHKYLMNGNISTLDIESYRTTTGFNVLTVDVEDLYNQYAYGINRHPLSIRNFIRHLIKDQTTAPEYLFLVGKGLKIEEYRNDPILFNASLVPPIGSPPSDIMLTSGIVDSLYTPAIATGRLSARNADHIDWYLSKLIEYESNQDVPKEWTKKIIHFGGGSNSSQQNQLATYLNNYKNIIEDTFFGAQVQSYFKTSTSSIQLNLSSQWKNIVNNGVSMMTFFGHAAGIGFDISLDHPSEYNNKGKYPFILANSCNAGDLFINTYNPLYLSASEEWTLIKDRGVIGYLASTTPAYGGPLNVYSHEFYKQLGYKNYGESVGKIIQNTISNVQGPGTKNVSLEMTLHGDPAVRINPHTKPDYYIDNSKVFFEPEIITTELDSFKINIIASNKGRAIDTSFFMEIVRTFPDNSIPPKKIIKRINAPFYADTISLYLHINPKTDLGINKISITLDSGQDIDEGLFENNNTTFPEITLNIKSANIIPVYPPKYAIIPSLNQELVGSTSDPFSINKSYVFQLDTSDQFNSPLMLSQQLSGSGGLIKWLPTFPITTDSIVYFWRVSLDSIYSGEFEWIESSFQYIEQIRGWSQAHFHQFKSDDYEYVSYNKPQRQFEFSNNVVSISAKTGYIISYYDIWYKRNAEQKNAVCHLPNTISVCVIDSVNGEFWQNPQLGNATGLYQSFNCRNYTLWHFEYLVDDSVARDNLENFLSIIPDGNYVLALSNGNHHAQDFTEDLYQQFESFGSGNVRTIANNIPFIMFGKKGSPIGSAKEVIGVDSLSIITISDSITTHWKEGYIKSELIGPSKKWKSAHWRFENSETHFEDQATFEITGIKTDGSSQVLLQQTDSLFDIYSLDTLIDASIFPYVHLITYMSDDSLHTPVQLRRWQLTYNPLPETAINAQKHFYFHKDTLLEGESVKLSIATENISDVNMDSLLVQYWLTDKYQNLLAYKKRRLGTHDGGSVMIDSVSFPTTNLNGLNSLWVEFNPIDSSSGTFDQLEQYHHNNIGQLNFEVEKDITNPLLDVTFDGVRILDGDIVSTNPQIHVLLNDENKFIALDDTANFKVYLKKPSSIVALPIYFEQNGQTILEFTPASLPDNECSIDYKPEFTEDGEYQLQIFAQDNAGNESGMTDYQISFNVINKSTITEVLNWPNPFSTSTRFVFTLTGSEVPTYFKIQIMTITGRIVREIDLDELGTLHIGRNITEYAWDGTDEYGDQLANGVYLYRVLTNINDKTIEKRENEASKYFNQGIGKMYLMR